ncbi:glycosyltransferase family 4 protein, partial [bacterium]
MAVERVIFYTHNPAPTAHEQFRVYSPLKQARMEVSQGFQGATLDLARIQDAQLVLFQRDFSRNFNDYQSVVNKARQAGVPLVLDLDDDILALPPNHPDRLSTGFANGLIALLCAIMEVDAITVTSPILKEVLEPYNPNIFVLPNYLDADIWTFRQPAQANAQDVVRILFMGTPTHKPDLEMIADALVKVVQRHGQRVNFIFFGIAPPSKIARIGKTRY